MKIIGENPYRLLGVFTNSSTKERVANLTKLKAFLKVGKQISYPLDLPDLLPHLVRTTENIAIAETKLSLPIEQMKYAEFWFVSSSPLDEIAFKHLFAGNVDDAIGIWEKKDSVSSLQNRIVCACIREDYSQVFLLSQKLYTDFVQQFITLVLGSDTAVTPSEAKNVFLDTLCDEVGANIILPHITNEDWRRQIGDRTIKPIINDIQSAIDVAEATRGKGIMARYNAGVKLMKQAQQLLPQLKAFLPTTDVQYQMIADKLGLTILQCGIDYFNDSEAADAARNAMKLQRYALSVVIGKMAKDRCKENVDILQKIIDNLPPSEVFAEDRAIHEELKKFCELPDKIIHAVTLLNNTKPHLQSIKTKLGGSNEYYLKISTRVVGNALSNIIAEVNETQSIFSADKGDPNAALAAILGISHVKSVLEEAWKATRIMDGFDMESNYKSERYNKNRSVLKEMCEQLGVSTSAYTPRTSTPLATQSKPASTARSYSSTTSGTPVNRHTTSSHSSSSSNNDHPWGCIITIFIILVLFATALVKCHSNHISGYANNDSTAADTCDWQEATPDSTASYYTDDSYYNSSSEVVEQEQYIDNRLKTGSKPYSSEYGKSKTGDNYLYFRTSVGCDYVVIVKKYSTGKVVNHVYIRGGDSSRIYVPNGTYSIYFYSGKGWNPHKEKGNVIGGFVSEESLQKDEPVTLEYQNCEYTLYPVQNGNLTLKSTNETDAF